MITTELIIPRARPHPHVHYAVAVAVKTGKAIRKYNLAMYVHMYVCGRTLRDCVVMSSAEVDNSGGKIGL